MAEDDVLDTGADVVDTSEAEVVVCPWCLPSVEVDDSVEVPPCALVDDDDSVALYPLSSSGSVVELFGAMYDVPGSVEVELSTDQDQTQPMASDEAEQTTSAPVQFCTLFHWSL